MNSLLHFQVNEVKMPVCSFILAFSMYALSQKNKLVTAPVSPNPQAETFTKSAHGTYVRHTNVISPSRSDSLRLLQRYSS